MSNLVFETTKKGDVVYEYGMGREIKSTIITDPEKISNTKWSFTSQMRSGEEIIYILNIGRDSPFNVKVYNYQAYVGFREYSGGGGY